MLLNSLTSLVWSSASDLAVGDRDLAALTDILANFDASCYTSDRLVLTSSMDSDPEDTSLGYDGYILAVEHMWPTG